MVDVSNSPESSSSYQQNDSNDLIDGIIPEDNVERLRNIRDMFENSRNEDDIELKKVEKLQPSEKLKQTFLNDIDFNFQTTQLILTMDIDNNCHKSINGDSPCVSNSDNHQVTSPSSSALSSSIPSPNDDSLNHDKNNNRFEEGVLENESNSDSEVETEQTDGIIRSTKKKKDIIPFAELNNVKTKFEKIAMEPNSPLVEPKPMRCITPPREGADRIEIENEPLQRPADIVSSNEKVEDALPDAGFLRSRKEIFDSIGSPESDTGAPRKKSITPPREDIIKRVLKEKTPERLDNVIRESDRNEDVLPSAGSIRQTAAIFTSGNRQKSIDRSGIVLEGELTEKGIAKSRLALFNDPSALTSPSISTNDQELEYIKNASGIAKERLSLFKNLEQNNGQRISPDRSVKKFKEFTPPPQLEPRQYIIISKESSPSLGNLVDSYNKDEYLPESGLARNRMKQYLEQTSSNGANTSLNETSELQGKGLAKSLLAKWKSIENIKEGSPEPKRQDSPGEEVPPSGHARNLLSKWQNIDNTKDTKERKGPKAFTPPPPEELNRTQESDDEQDTSKNQVFEDELALLKGAAKNTLKKFEQSMAESNNRVKRTVTPPKDYIKQAVTAPVKTVFESQPLESNINSHYVEEEIIPSQGSAKNLKNKFLNLEKEAAKIETSSSKMNYVPKKFTSATKPTAEKTETTTTTKSAQPKPQPGKLNSNGLLTTVQNGNSSQNQTEKCSICDKTVYAMEKTEADKKVYHKACFKCTSCNCPLNLPTVEFDQNKPYCLQNCKSKSNDKNNNNKELGVIVIDTSYATGSSTKSPKSTASQSTPKSPSKPINSPNKSVAPSPKPALTPNAPSPKPTLTPNNTNQSPKVVTSQKSPSSLKPTSSPKPK
ncbi:unnamed protein product [Brachionus calyciflorus]|uniref:LIM zinc-binding domain-containing protein n=1 Tax=Brachionus calyciflorus TaxID=104777 RepID=A0A813TBW3_9BILA|nr:unnamed protein product [Brachionus calyciflorus]